MDLKTKKQISCFLNSIGIAPNYRGYTFLVYVIWLGWKEFETFPKAKELFELAGAEFGVTPRIVRDSIQTLLVAYRNQKENCRYFKSVTNYPTPENITLKEFVSVICEFLKNHY